MARYVDISLLKKDRGIVDDSDSDLLQFYLDTAEQQVEMGLQRPLSELSNEQGDLPLPIQLAIIKLAATWYEYREGVIPGQVQAVPYSNPMMGTLPYTKFT